MEEELPARLSEGQVAEFIEHDEVHARQDVGHPAVASGAALGFEPLHEVDDVEVTATGSVAYAYGDGRGNGACGVRCGVIASR